MTDASEIEEWVDKVLDLYEAWHQEPTCIWSKYLQRHQLRRPGSILAYNTDALRDAAVWLYDGGMSPRHIATTVALGDKRAVMELLENVDVDYEEDEG